jgi:hypothetical protein
VWTRAQLEAHLPAIAQACEAALARDFPDPVGYQVLAILALQVGAALPEPVRARILLAIAADEWGREGDMARVRHLANLVDAVRAHEPGRTWRPAREGLLEKIAGMAAPEPRWEARAAGRGVGPRPIHGATLRAVAAQGESPDMNAVADQFRASLPPVMWIYRDNVYASRIESSCPTCGALAIVALPPEILAEQPDDTTHVCLPVAGGCNGGFAAPRSRAVARDARVSDDPPSVPAADPSRARRARRHCGPWRRRSSNEIRPSTSRATRSRSRSATLTQ